MSAAEVAAYLEDYNEDSGAADYLMGSSEDETAVLRTKPGVVAAATAAVTQPPVETKSFTTTRRHGKKMGKKHHTVAAPQQQQEVDPLDSLESMLSSLSVSSRISSQSESIRSISSGIAQGQTNVTYRPLPVTMRLAERSFETY